MIGVIVSLRLDECVGYGFDHFLYVGAVGFDAVGYGLQEGANGACLLADMAVAINVVLGLAWVNEYFAVL